MVTIINLRGSHGSGKSTVIRRLLERAQWTPIYGILGARMPEAYRCHFDSPYPVYVLGPYHASAGHAGFDYITKKGMPTVLTILDRYAALGTVVFEAAMLSCRYCAPTFGVWAEARRPELVALCLTTTLAQCKEALATRKLASTSAVNHSGKHIDYQQRMYELVCRKLEANGFRVEYVSRDGATDRILEWIK